MAVGGSRGWLEVSVAILAVAGCMGVLGCKREPAGQAPGAASSTPAASAETPSLPRVEGDITLSPGMPITLCIRPRKPGNPFAPNAAAYDCSTEIAATQAPWGGGGVPGSVVFAAVRRAHPGSGVIYARSLDPGDDPVSSGVTGIEIDDDAQQFFGKYARKDDRGGAVMFIEVEKP